MMKYRNLFSFTILLAAIFLSGCYKDQNPVEPIHSSNPSNVTKLTIPLGAVVDSAFFFINADTAADVDVSLHAVTGPWDESTVTWNSFGGAFNPAPEGVFTPSAVGWYGVNVSALVLSWLDSSLANNGILLKEDYPGALQFFSGRESGNSAYLKVYWTLNGQMGFDSTQAAADAFIKAGDPDSNFGDSTALITGWEDSSEVQTLVGFEIEQTPVFSGCTHGYGYWKTHSANGPAPYDSTWALLGEDSTFFLSGQSNIDVMWTPPKHGNAYYMLAHEYITTWLNFLNGADPADAQAAFDSATALFLVYTPDQIGDLNGGDPLRHQFISLKNTLAMYNSGEIGPGNCDISTEAPKKKY